MIETYPSQQLTNSTTQREKSVPLEMNQLNNVTATLSKIIDELCSRLMPVLRVEEPQSAPPDSASRESQTRIPCALADSISTERRAIESAVRRIECIIIGLEV